MEVPHWGPRAKRSGGAGDILQIILDLTWNKAKQYNSMYQLSITTGSFVVMGGAGRGGSLYEPPWIRH